MDFLPKLQLIDPNRIPRFDFHLHTTWTDGKNSVREMHEQAVASNLEYVLFSEHARKTSEEWFERFAREIRSLPSQGCQALVGVETKVEDFEGNIDCTDKILAHCDLVMASVHRFPDKKGAVRDFNDVSAEEAVETEFHLAEAVLDNEKVDILGHPFGMSYRRFGCVPSEEKIIALIRKAAKKRKAFEINCYYHPDPWKLIRWCQQYGAYFSLGSNAHEIGDVGRVIKVLEGKESAWIPSVS